MIIGTAIRIITPIMMATRIPVPRATAPLTALVMSALEGAHDMPLADGQLAHVFIGEVTTEIPPALTVLGDSAENEQ